MANHGKSILIVDDEEDTRIYFASLLQDNGFDTIEAVDGEEGWEKVKKLHPNLVTLDMSMPQKSGVKLYREMKESTEYRDIPIIIITGVSDTFKDFISSCRQVPSPEGYLSKPIIPEQFLELVEQLLNG